MFCGSGQGITGRTKVTDNLIGKSLWEPPDGGCETEGKVLSGILLYLYIFFGVAMVIERNLVVVLYRKSFLSLFFLRRYGILGAWVCVFKSSERVLNL